MARNSVASFAPFVQSWIADLSAGVTKGGRFYSAGELFQYPVRMGLTKYAGDLRGLILGQNYADASQL
eukprot:8870671-Pyramimonas_sp.AAC.2